MCHQSKCLWICQWICLSPIKWLKVKTLFWDPHLNGDEFSLEHLELLYCSQITNEKSTTMAKHVCHQCPRQHSSPGSLPGVLQRGSGQGPSPEPLSGVPSRGPSNGSPPKSFIEIPAKVPHQNPSLGSLLGVPHRGSRQSPTRHS